MKNLYLTNTLSKEKELFTPITPGRATVYHCGPTVYWTQHIGNMRAMVFADTVHRSLRSLGYDVEMVRNYTDVGHLTGENAGNPDEGEDKMAKAARRDNLSVDEIADKYITEFDRDIQSLNTLPIRHLRATDHITEMVDLVSTLLDKGFAYATPLAIYFDISKAENYTRLSGQDLSKLISGTGHGSVDDQNSKRNPGDFSLWFFAAGSHEHALQTWDSPFTSPLVENGRGFPGWHIECSAMSMQALGETIDIHLGGIEHIPIHHTNEIAQSECATGKTFANYWLHNEWLMMNNEKMSKSDGNVAYLSDITERGYGPLSLRYFFLQAHYRSQQNFTWEALAASATALSRLRLRISDLQKSDTKSSVDEASMEAFMAFITDDLNTSGALAQVYELLKSDLSDEIQYATIMEMDQILGLELGRIEATEEIPDDVKSIMEQRKKAREDKDWDASDQLRDQAETLGWIIRDESDGQDAVRS